MRKAGLTSIFLGFLFVCSGTTSRQAVDEKSSNEQLLHAAEIGDTATARKLLQNGANIEAKDGSGWTPLVRAAKLGHVEIVELLLEKGPSLRDKTEALFWAAAGGPALLEQMPQPGPQALPQERAEATQYADYTKVVKLLLDHGVDTEARNELGSTPLIRAAAFGRVGVVKLLLDRGAYLEAKDSDGNTALIAAACKCAVATMPSALPVIKLLLAMHADVNAKDNDGATALMRASAENAKLLLENGAAVDAEDNAGNTALHIAALGSALPTADLAKVLLDCGAHIEAKNHNGDTPLILAVSGNSFDQAAIVKLLLARGANPHTRDKQGRTVYELAAKTGNQQVIDLLRQTKSQ